MRIAIIGTGIDVAFAYDADDPRDWMGRYFFTGCARLWGYRGGRDFGVSHYLFEPRPSR